MHKKARNLTGTPWIDRYRNKTYDAMVRELRSDPNGLMEVLETGFRQSKSTGLKLHEIYSLYTVMLRRRPTNVLELGCGISTIVLGYAALRLIQQGFTCKVTSMEESQSYADNLSEWMPVILSGIVDVIVSSVETEIVADDWVSFFYANTPLKHYDLVFVDGPQYPKRVGERTGFDGDVVRIVGRSGHPATVLIDGREETQAAVAELLSPSRIKTLRYGPSVFKGRIGQNIAKRTILRRLEIKSLVECTFD